MQKTKLGVSVGLVGALAYFTGIFSGYQLLIIIAGYVLLCEENPWLKKTCVKALVLLLTFSVTIDVIGLIPDLFNWLSNLIGILNISVSFAIITNLIYVITSALSIVRTVLFLLLGLKAFDQGDIPLGFIDKFVGKHIQ